MLLFASDYPHWDFEDPTFLRIPEDWRERVLDTNAREVFGLPERPAGASGAATAAVSV